MRVGYGQDAHLRLLKMNARLKLKNKTLKAAGDALAKAVDGKGIEDCHVCGGLHGDGIEGHNEGCALVAYRGVK